jgi:anionic cell wall polymer biosynthesis LytR-Cps2A-Psr (LCP) family protein
MGDFGRAQRQRQVLAAVVTKLSSASSVLKVNDIAKVVGKYVKTDIPISDGLALYKKFSGFDASSIQTITLEGEDERINGVYYFAPSKKSVDKVHDKLMQNLGLMPAEESSSSKEDTQESDTTENQ